MVNFIKKFRSVIMCIYNTAITMTLWFTLVILAITMVITLTCFKDSGRIQGTVALLLWLSARKCSILFNNNLLNYSVSYFSNPFQ